MTGKSVMEEEAIKVIREQFAFQTATQIRSCDTGRTKGCVYACIVKEKYLYVGITENTLTQRILEHLRHPKTRFTRMIGDLAEHEVLWAVLEHHPFTPGSSKRVYREDLGEAEKCWIKRWQTFNTDHGLNETAGGKGTQEVKRSEEWITSTVELKKKLYSDPQRRQLQSQANKEAHRLNPNIAAEHSRIQKARYNGKNADIERQKVSKGVKSYLSDANNLAQHAWDRGARPFAVINTKGIQGVFLNRNECARKFRFSSSSHISKSLKNPGKTYLGYSFINIGLGMTYEEILEKVIDPHTIKSTADPSNEVTDIEPLIKTAWRNGARPFVVVIDHKFCGAFLDKDAYKRKLQVESPLFDQWGNEEILRFDDSVLVPIGLGLTTEEILKYADCSAQE
jgi:hypothetical protein